MRIRPRWKRYGLIAAGVAGAVLLGGLVALSIAPAWYDPPAIPREDRQKVRNNLIDAEQAFTEGLRAGKTFVYHIFQDDVNRWIAMRREIYPLIDELTPAPLEDPFVAFEQGVIRVAGRYRLGVVRAVLSMDVAVSFEHEKIVLRATSIRCGAVRAPRTFGKLGLDTPIDSSAGEVWPGSPIMKGDFVSGFAVGDCGWWKNGGIDYRVRNVAVVPGRIDLTVEPLGHHAPKARSDQPDSPSPERTSRKRPTKSDPAQVNSR